MRQSRQGPAPLEAFSISSVERRNLLPASICPLNQGSPNFPILSKDQNRELSKRVGHPSVRRLEEKMLRASVPSMYAVKHDFGSQKVSRRIFHFEVCGKFKGSAVILLIAAH